MVGRIVSILFFLAFAVKELGIYAVSDPTIGLLALLVALVLIIEPYIGPHLGIRQV